MVYFCTAILSFKIIMKANLSIYLMIYISSHFWKIEFLGNSLSENLLLSELSVS